MKKDRRWMKSIIAASHEAQQVTLPWARGTRQRPAAMKDEAKAKPRAIAAR
jgi:hypothetical protein